MTVDEPEIGTSTAAAEQGVCVSSVTESVLVVANRGH
jgi:hypothetical protein